MQCNGAADALGARSTSATANRRDCISRGVRGRHFTKGMPSSCLRKTWALQNVCATVAGTAAGDSGSRGTPAPFSAGRGGGTNFASSYHTHNLPMNSSCANGGFIELHKVCWT